MKSLYLGFICLVGVIALGTASARADVTLVKNGQAQVVILAPTSVMVPNIVLPLTATAVQKTAETQRQILRESVNDLASYLGKMSGAKIEIVSLDAEGNTEPKDGRLPIYIGALAEKKFGPVKQTAAYKQGFRMVVSKGGVGLFGESEESTSYAIYEVLHRQGCRWFIASELGEVIPSRPTIALPETDFAGAPGTWYRGIWYSDADFRRRNRMGGQPIAASHALEQYVTEAQRKEHPEWRAIIGGQPHASRLKWSNPGVQQAVADAMIAQLDKRYMPSISISPDDGGVFDESDDKAWDAGDYDSVMAGPSITDRYIKFCNIVAEKVAQKYPDVKLGFLAYVQYTQAPVREKLHPNLVPMFAPINYCRAHAMTDASCPSRQHVKKILEGWSKVCGAISYYNYMFNLGEYSAPYPMIHQMKEELPIIYANHVKYWQPEGMTNQDQIMPGHYLSLRKAWNPNENSDAILDEFFTMFYGNAEAPMRTYWTMFDDQWTNVDEHAGGGWDYVRRFTPEFMKQARTVMDGALASCRSITEYRRVKMQDAALCQFERWMKLLWDLNSGKLARLGPESQKWMGSQLHLSEEYAKQYAFSGVSWEPVYNAAALWMRDWFQPAYLDATRIFKNFRLISTPLADWKYCVDKAKSGEQQGLFSADFHDTDWKTTKLGVDMWSTLGLADYFGPVWYRASVKVQRVPEGKKVFLWVSREDGNVKLWVNGQHVPYVNDKGEAQEEFKNGYGKPLSFDITAALKPGAENQITLRGTRVFINELGTGGLLAPVYLYSEK
ncbi:MAG: DUF4838 domain-containing protein [Methylacidiphilales bacterium]|nr:DUF4838 domain-containing protein [Candidatus Methylacidiphilales bacterium]